MDKQHSDYIENRIRQAAERITTPVTEEAWQKMEALLDKQEQKKRRRGIFWWWYLLLIVLVTGSGLWYLSSRQNHVASNQQQSAVRSGIENSGNEKQSSKPVAGQANGLTPAPEHSAAASPGVKNEHPIAVVPGTKTNLSIQPPSLTQEDSKPARNKNGGGDRQDRQVSGSYNKAETSNNKRARQLNANQDDPHSAGTQSSANQATDNKSLVSADPTEAGKSQNPELKTQVSDSAVAKTGEPVMEESPPIDSIVTTKADKKPSGHSPPVNKPGFYLTASFATDATSIEKISFNTYKPVYGVGIGYRFTNRVSMQTGFFAGRKIYRAGPGDYKLRPGSYVREIIYIDAECFIYEVPLLVRYDVLVKRKYNVYAATGLSTYFFKKENYDFHYLNQAGAYRRTPYNYKNNADYFSVASISVGFEYKILPNLSLQAEPYTKIPLSGLGEGKVKLTSAGVFAGIRYQPFYKKRKQ
ncbi:MAG TPA: hypothetical protein VEZ17_04625 [Chitinophagaceae bacterium]|nr:hypothetical protein [Chitinophagaceae bacterium]